MPEPQGPAAQDGPSSSSQHSEQLPDDYAYNDAYSSAAGAQEYAAQAAADADAACESAGTAARGAEHDPGPPSSSAADAALLHVGGGVYGISERDDLSAEDGHMDPAVLAERRGQQLKLERRAREELEDMLLRIERHFKAETAARKQAEELLAAAIGSEAEARAVADKSNRTLKGESEGLAMEREAVKRERQALDIMQQDFEQELQQARMEVAKAQNAMANTEDRVRTSEHAERARMAIEYESHIAQLNTEIERLRGELEYRTRMMHEEMERWRHQAHQTAAAVVEAKREVMERKRELESTKDKMDTLIDTLYAGRERGLQMHAAITAAQHHAQGNNNNFARQTNNSTNAHALPRLPGLKSAPSGTNVYGGYGASSMYAGGGNPYNSSAYGQQYGQQPHTLIQEERSGAAGANHSGYGSHIHNPSGEHSNRQHSGGETVTPQRSRSNAGALKSQRHGTGSGGNGGGSYAAAAAHQHGDDSGGGSYAMQHASKLPAIGSGPYGHVQSKYAAAAAKYSQNGSAQARAQQTQRQKSMNKPPDRMAEAEKSAKSLAAAAQKWQ